MNENEFELHPDVRKTCTVLNNSIFFVEALDLHHQPMQ
jgi:hypothetical protein